MRGCERCGAGSEDFGENEDSVRAAMCDQVQFVHGHMAFACFDCRKMWASRLTTDKTAKEYQITAFRLDCWKIKLAAKGEGDMKAGETLWQQLEALENELVQKVEAFMKEERDVD